MTEQLASGSRARTVAALAHELVKVYGTDEAEVRALDGVTVDL
jgi:putative ABC transport system ATP-binding protein